MKAIIYARVSSREQEETGYSLPAQTKLLEEYAAKNQLEVVKSFAVSESASKAEQRASFAEMFVYADAHNVKIVLCEKSDRLTRNMKDAVMVNDWLEADRERQVHLVKEGWTLEKESKSHQKFTWNIKVSVAQFYTDNLSEEVKKGRKEKAEQGWFPARSPLGYMSQGDSGKKIHLLDPQTAPLVSSLFTMYATGAYSMSQVTEQAWKIGLRTRNGKKMAKSRIAYMLSDCFYYGSFNFLGKIWQGKHQPLISKEVFDQVQKVAAGKTTPKTSRHEFAYKALVHCHECGRLMTWETQKGHVYGHCKNYSGCIHRSTVREEVVDESLKIAFDGLKLGNSRLVDWVGKVLKETNSTKADYDASVRLELIKRADNLRQKLDRIYDDKLDNLISAETYKRKYEEFATELETVNQSLVQIDNAGGNYQEKSVQLFEIAQTAGTMFVKSAPAKKRELANLIFTEITAAESGIEYAYSKPFQLLHEAVELANSSKLMASVVESSLTVRTDVMVTGKAKLEVLNKILGRQDSNL